MNSADLPNALFTKTQQRVLGLLYGAPAKSFYTNEIVRIASVGRGTVTRELVKLADAQVLTVCAQKNQKFYQANPACPIYAELVKIARKLLDVQAPKTTVKPVKVKAGSATKSVDKKADQARQSALKKRLVNPAVVKEAGCESGAAQSLAVDDEGQLGLF